MPGSPALSLVIPMYNEANRISGTIEALAEWPSLGSTEVIFVDDGSTDSTVTIVEASALRLPCTQILCLPSNRGKGAAVRAGVLAATAPVVAFADADLSASLQELDRCVDELLTSGADVVFASRACPTSTIVAAQPRVRQTFGQFFNLLLRLLGLTNFSDTQCGLKVFRSGVVAKLFDPLRTERFAFDVEVLTRAARLGYAIREVPIAWHHVEESRVSPLRDGYRMLRDAVQLRRALGPARDLVRVEMEPSRFEVMAALERRHWWFRAKREVVASAITTHLAHPTGFAIDVGCGTGETLRSLGELGFRRVVGGDPSDHAIRHTAALASNAALVAFQAERLPFATGAASCVTSLDVIEHLDDDVLALRELARVAQAGLVVCTVPAYQWAWSQHDVSLGHKRRYNRRQLVAAAQAAGLTVLECRYLFHFLVVLAALTRRTPLRHLIRRDAESVSYVNNALNAALWALVRVEHLVARFVSVPFGLSILLVATSDPSGPK